MAMARTLALALSGVDGHVVEVEADLSAGLPGLTFTGLADAAVVEARDRIRAAVLNSGADWPNRRITLALLPADVRKVGSRFDLAMALAVLAAAGAVPPASIAGAAWIAELGLDGRLRPIRGVLPAVIAAKHAGIEHVVVAQGNAAEAALVSGVDIRAAQTLAEVIAWLRGDGPAPSAAVPGVDVPAEAGPDLAEVAGQGAARRALEICNASRGRSGRSTRPPPGMTPSGVAPGGETMFIDVSARANLNIDGNRGLDRHARPHRQRRVRPLRRE